MRNPQCCVSGKRPMWIAQVPVPVIQPKWYGWMNHMRNWHFKQKKSKHNKTNQGFCQCISIFLGILEKRFALWTKSLALYTACRKGINFQSDDDMIDHGSNRLVQNMWMQCDAIKGAEMWKDTLTVPHQIPFTSFTAYNDLQWLIQMTRYQNMS